MTAKQPPRPERVVGAATFPESRLPASRASAEARERLAQRLGVRVEHVGRQALLLAPEVHVVGMIERQEVQVAVRHLEPDDREPIRRIHCTYLRPARSREHRDFA